MTDRLAACRILLGQLSQAVVLFQLLDQLLGLALRQPGDLEELRRVLLEPLAVDRPFVPALGRHDGERDIPRPRGVERDEDLLDPVGRAVDEKIDATPREVVQFLQHVGPDARVVVGPDHQFAERGTQLPSRAPQCNRFAVARRASEHGQLRARRGRFRDELQQPVRRAPLHIEVSTDRPPALVVPRIEAFGLRRLHGDAGMDQHEVGAERRGKAIGLVLVDGEELPVGLVRLGVALARQAHERPKRGVQGLHEIGEGRAHALHPAFGPERQLLVLEVWGDQVVERTRRPVALLREPADMQVA